MGKKPKEAPVATPAPLVRKRPAILKSGNASSSKTEIAGPVLPGSRDALFPGWTGKTPLSLLYEACQKRGWDKPVIESSRVRGGKGFTGHVILRRSKPKSEEVHLRPPVDSLERSTAAEAKHWVAIFALFRFANGQSIRMILPPACRDYWTALEEEKKQSPDHLAWLWASDPFAAATEQEAKKQAKEAGLKTKEEGTAEPNRFWQTAPQVFMADHLRQLVEQTVRGVLGSQNQMGIEGPALDIDPELKSHLLQLGFRAKYVEATLQHLSSTPRFRFAQDMTAKTAAIEWLCLICPEDDLSKAFSRTKPAEMSIRDATAGSSSELAMEWEAQTLREEGFPLLACRRCLAQAGGDRGVALDLLLRQLCFEDWDKSSADELVSLVEADDDAVRADRRALRNDEALVLESIYGHAYQRGNGFIDLDLGREVVLRWHLHAKSLYPSDSFGLPTLTVRSTRLPVYLRLHLTRLAMCRFQDPVIADQLEAGEGNAVGEVAIYLKDILLQELDRPPDPQEVMAVFEKRDPCIERIAVGPQAIPAFSSYAQSNGFSQDTRTAIERYTRTIKMPRYSTRLEARAKLPAFSMREELLATIERNRVTLIVGETGSGKTTQVPAFVMEEWLGRGSGCSIIVTQPRRLSAISVARRVAVEHGEEVDGGAAGLIGYAIRGERHVGRDTCLLFCTTGILLRRLGASEPDLQSVTHVFVDEVHERSIDSDILLLELKELLKRNTSIKVVLMSATIQEHVFASYFRAAVVRIPGRTYPVEDFYLEDLLRGSDHRPSLRGGLAKMSALELDSMRASFSSSVSPDKIDVLCNIARASSFDFALIGEAVKHIASSALEGAILVFCSGVAEIGLAVKAVKEAAVDNLLILELHASLSPEKQASVFRPAPKGRRKVILATNVAETSITIDDIAFVVDTGRVKETAYDSLTGLSRLVEVQVSKASAQQRRGRAGRTKVGQCWRLYDKHWTWERMVEQSQPEIMRTPLEQVVLSVKAAHSHESASVHLGKAISPPDLQAINAAEATLCKLGALQGVGAESRLTPLGEHLSMLPIDVRLGKMLILGSVFGCTSPMLTIAALLSAKALFISPQEQREASSAARKRFANADSDLLTNAAAFESCRSFNEDSIALWKHCETNYISYSAVLEVTTLRKDLATALQSTGFHDEDSSTQSSHNENLLRAIVFASTQNLVRVQLPEARFDEVAAGTIQRQHEAREVRYFEPPPNGRVFLHPSSILFDQPRMKAAFVTYFAKNVTSKPFLRDVTVVPSWGVLLFGGQGLKSEGDGVIVRLQDVADGWCRFRAWSRVGALASALRRLLEEELRRRIDEPQTTSRSPVIEAMHALLARDGR